MIPDLDIHRTANVLLKTHGHEDDPKHAVIPPRLVQPSGAPFLQLGVDLGREECFGRAYQVPTCDWLCYAFCPAGLKPFFIFLAALIALTAS